MKRNMGIIDKAIRIIIAAVIAALYFSGVISGTVAVILGILSIVLIVTSFLSFCPLYVPFGINTCKIKKR
jgi:hypothetical protein